MKKLFFIVAFFTFAGCAPFHDPNKSNIVASYEIDMPNEANTGSAMVTIYNRGFRYLNFTPRFIQQSTFGTITPGQLWTAFRVFDDNKYLVTSNQFDDENVGIVIDKNGEITDKQPIMINLTKIPIITLFRVLSGEQYKRIPLDNLKETKMFVRTGILLKNDGDFSAELIYGGVSNNIISLSYREFYKDLARPAFYQEMKYDLNTSNIITFKTIKMKILEANNSRIAFQVLEDGGLAWVPRP